MDALTRTFAVEPLGDDRFGVAGERGDGHRDTMYGGLVMGQAIQAATATVDAGYDLHHLHAEFLRAGRAGNPVVFEVERSKDGRSLSNRRVVGRQDGRTIIDVQVSYQAQADAGPEYHQPADNRFPTAAVDSGELTPTRGMLGVDRLDLTAYPPAGDGTRYEGWFRAADPLPDDWSWHAGVFALTTDMSVPSTPIAAIGMIAAGPDLETDGVATTTINHTMWFHRRARADEWFVIVGGPLSTSYSRGLALGRVYDGEGRHVVSFAQEIYVI